MDLTTLKSELVPALLKFQEFRDSISDEAWDQLQDDWNNELLLDSLTEIEDQLVKVGLLK